MFHATVTSGAVHGRDGTTLYDRDEAVLTNRQFQIPNDVAEVDAALFQLEESLSCSMNKKLSIERGDRIEYDVAGWCEKCCCSSQTLAVDQDTVGLKFDWCCWPDILCSGSRRYDRVVPWDDFNSIEMDTCSCCGCCTCRSIITDSGLEQAGGITSGCLGCCKSQKLGEILNVMRRRRLEFQRERCFFNKGQCLIP